ncbi:hypothetical protein AB0I60_33090 [Actinosynnema sp. NPDC050436]|uniref:hypothetical protein n=1 Tax=Actinosynnema sp. NPDC050436 TaxID=3155659 RepID=UPI0033DC8C15
MSTQYDDPDRTPPRGFPVGGRQPDAWAAAEQQHLAARRARPPVEPRVGPVAARPEAVAHRPPDARADRRTAHAPAEDEAVHDSGFTPDPEGGSVAPAVIGGDLPEAAPAPPPPRPVERSAPPANPTKRSFLGKLFNRNG